MIGGQVLLQAATSTPAAAPIISKQNRYTCVGCRVNFDTSERQRNHFKTEWHLYNLKRRVCNLSAIDSQSFQLIQESAPTREEQSEQQQRKASSSNIDHQLPSGSRGGNSNNRKLDARNRNSTPDNEKDDEEDWDDVDEEELVDEDYDEEEAAEMLARVVKSDTCLFCDKKSSHTKNNLVHMNLMHGFFVPEEKYVIDLEGLMEYLGFKVGAGATCLWCSKQFASLHGVRRHMINKDHCKILYDQEKSLEFKEFYDYATQDKFQMKPLNELVIVKRRHERKATSGYGSSSKSLVPGRPGESAGRALVRKNAGGQSMLVSQARAYKKFDAYRAKILLRTGMANNQTMRGRLRQQNPI